MLPYLHITIIEIATHTLDFAGNSGLRWNQMGNCRIQVAEPACSYLGDTPGAMRIFVIFLTICFSLLGSSDELKLAQDLYQRTEYRKSLDLLDQIKPPDAAA